MRISPIPSSLPRGAAGGRLPAGPARSANLRIVRETFRKWSAGEGSLDDLMTEDAVIVIPGTAPHCGSFGKGAFVGAGAGPFLAGFRRRPAPGGVRLWWGADDVVVLADAVGTRRDGKPYANSYIFVLTMRAGRVVRATEFLDMAAFNDVWDHVEAAPAATKAAPR